MSRAIDDDTKKAIKHGDHEKVFDAIASALTQKQPELLEIEFLPRSHVLDEGSFIIQDGPALAIPKLRLVQSFIFARKIIFNRTAYGAQDGFSTVMKATAVMLLMDPEHLTAANTRKRLLLEEINSRRDITTHLQNERYLIDSFLTSRLHRHTKSPTLWNHRQWLMERFRNHDLEIDALDTMKTVTFVAAERHPRNYYSWLHARYLISTSGFNKSIPEEKAKLAEILNITKGWAFKHHDDISGWAFLMFFLNQNPEHAGTVLSETLRLAASFHWRNEAVWYFLRNMVVQVPDIDSAVIDEFHDTRVALSQGVSEERIGERLALDNALSWVETYST